MLQHRPPTRPRRLWEDFLDLFVAPSAVIARRQGQSAIPPLLIVIALLSLMIFINHTAIAPIYDAQLTARAQRATSLGHGMSETEVASAIDVARKVNVVLDVAGVPIAILLFAARVWVVGRIAGVAVRGEDAVVVAAYASVLDVVLQVSRTVQALVCGPSHFDSLAALSFGPARLLAADAPLAATALALQLDPFVVWKIAVAGLGICAIGRVATRQKLVGVVILLWLGVTLPGVARALTSH